MTKKLPADSDVSTFLGRNVIPPKVAVYPIEKGGFTLGAAERRKGRENMTAPEREMIRWGKLLFERRLISGWGGDRAAAGSAGKSFSSPDSTAPLGFLTSKDLVRINHEGKPTSEKQRASQ